MATQGLVESSVRFIASFEGAITGNKSLGRRFFGEALFCSESKHIRVESSVLTHDMVEGLVLKKYFAIQFCIVFSIEILPPLIGILLVADPVERSEGFGSLAIIEATGSICEGFQRVAAFLLIGVVVGELGPPHCLVALGLKWRRVG